MGWLHAAPGDGRDVGRIYTSPGGHGNYGRAWVTRSGGSEGRGARGEGQGARCEVRGSGFEVRSSKFKLDYRMPSDVSFSERSLALADDRHERIEIFGNDYAECLRLHTA